MVRLTTVNLKLCVIVVSFASCQRSTPVTCQTGIDCSGEAVDDVKPAGGDDPPCCRMGYVVYSIAEIDGCFQCQSTEDLNAPINI